MFLSRRLNASKRLTAKIKGLKFKNPLAIASGNAGFGFEYERVIGFNYSNAGAVFLKGTTLKKREGNPGIRVVETPLGLVNSVGLQNPGADYVIANYLPRLNFKDTNFIPNISGSSIDEYVALASKFNATKIDAIEINISCPNIKQGGVVFGTNPKMAAEVVKATREATNKIIIVKLSPNQTNIQHTVEKVIEAGADIISAINTVNALSIDLHTRKPHLTFGYGGLSGPSIKPIALFLISKIYQVTKSSKVPIIGLGGVSNYEDVLEFVLAGANIVALGSILAKDSLIIPKINWELDSYLKQEGIGNLQNLVGKLEL